MGRKNKEVKMAKIRKCNESKHHPCNFGKNILSLIAFVIRDNPCNLLNSFLQVNLLAPLLV